MKQTIEIPEGHEIDVLTFKKIEPKLPNKMKQSAEISKEDKGNGVLANVSSRVYQIDFGNHLRCKLKITDDKIEVEGAINGWGNYVPLEQVVILDVKKCDKN